MKKIPIGCGIALVLALALSTAASPVNVYYVEGPQDAGGPNGQWDELGVGFPANELISTQDLGTTSQTACFDGSDQPGIPNRLVSMTNLTSRSFYEPWYVADPETTITNFDGWVGDVTQPGGEQPAFMIDGMGTNRPLISGDVNGNFAFDPQETWTFILQDWSNAMGGPANAFDSVGIASVSVGWPPSTGSIIAFPEPATLGLLAAGGLAILRRRSR